MCEFFGSCSNPIAMLVLFACMLGGMIVIASLIANFVGLKMFLSRFHLKLGIEAKDKEPKTPKEKKTKDGANKKCDNGVVVLLAVGIAMMSGLFAMVMALVFVL